MPAAPTITLVDNEDGTGTVTVSGSDGGTTNTAYTAPARGGLWTSGGTCTGDDDIVVTRVGGIYHWRVESSDGAVSHSNVVLNRVSGSTQTVYERILEQVHSDIQAASLTGIKKSQVVLQTSPQANSTKVILVAPYGKEGFPDTGLNCKDNIMYPVIVAHIDPGNRDQGSELRNRRLGWRQDISRLFRKQHLTGVSEVYECKPRYMDQIDTNAWFKSNECVGAIVLEFIAREVRTL
jgi:hypothetical protein